ncbi:MAG: hypothetical protein AAB403_12675 [Planctomycetota bacterium]
MTEPQSTQSDAASRPALYYPYIHIRDENWLKGAILGFQQVRRIVPARFTVKDEAITRPYAELEGPAGPLLEAVLADAPQIQQTQSWLHGKVVERLPEIKARYSQDRTPPSQQSGPDAFQMHTGKFLDEGLLALLKKERLAWHSREPTEPDSWNWVTMHPKFGSAMMSVLAIAVARIQGLSVLTPSGRAHHELLANREAAVFEKLLEVPQPGGIGDAAGVTVEELAHVVITTGFDLTRLKPADILELLKEGKDLRAFRAAAASYAARIPAEIEGEERVRRLKQEAGAVLEEWRKYSGSLPEFAKGAIVDAALDKAPGNLVEAGLAAAGVGAVATAVIGAVPGLLISIAVAAGVKMFRKPDTPLRFLSRINDLAGHRIGSIYVPQWRALAAQAA